MNVDSPHFNAGAQLALFMRGESSASLVEKEATLEELRGSVPYNTVLCNAMSGLYAAVGKSASFERCLLELVTKRAAVGDLAAQEMQAELADIFHDVIGSVEALDKEAVTASGGRLAAQTAGRLGLAGAPGALKTLMAAGVGVGTLGGALHWAANRDATSDEADLEAMKARIEEYDRITREITEKMERKGLKPEDPNQQEKIKKLTGAEQVSVYD